MLALLTGPAVLVIGSLAMPDWVTGSRRWRMMAAAALGVAAVSAVALVWEVAPTLAAYGVASVPLVALAINNRGGGVGGPATELPASEGGMAT